jgi:hypothetical protein
MDDNHAHGDEQQGRRRTRRRAGVPAAALTCLALLAVACSSPASSGTGAGTAAGGSAGHTALGYSQCMRAHGITAFPDPNSQGGIDINGGSGIDPNSSQYQAAHKACKSLLPATTMNPAQQAGVRAGNLKYAECMRAHGISDFPDPNGQGLLQIQVKPGSDLDPNNSRFQAANKVCQHYQPGGGQGGSLSNSGPGGGGA